MKFIYLINYLINTKLFYFSFGGGSKETVHLILQKWLS